MAEELEESTGRDRWRRHCPRYHLTIGWDDVVLLERKQLTSGTTWHAAGLIGQLRDSQNMTKLAKYTAELYLSWKETGQATGYKINGSLSTATHVGRMEDLSQGRYG